MAATKEYGDGKDIRRILAAMITNKTVISRVAPRWTDRGLFAAEWSNLVGGWAVDHYRTYDKPINRQINPVFEGWGSGGDQSEKVISAVESLLQFVSDEDEHESDSDEFLIDLAEKHFNRVKIQRAIDDADQELTAGNDDEAYLRLAEAQKIDLGAGGFIKPAEDFSVWHDAFNPERRKPLVPYQGALHKFFANAFCRGTLYAFQASDKVGKSFFLLDLAFRAMRDRKRIAYFESGDLGLSDTIVRMGQRAARWPIRPTTCRVPSRFDKDDGLIVEEKTYESELDARVAFRAFSAACRTRDRFRLSCHANSTINVAGIESILDGWARENWKADIVVIDYADILAPPDGYREKIEQIDQTWKALRRLSQQRNALVVTATQTKATAYMARGGTQGRQHFSGSKSKLAEANGIIALNQTGDEAQKDMWRLNWIIHRHSGYNDASWVNVAGCREIGCPVLVSGW